MRIDRELVSAPIHELARVSPIPFDRIANRERYSESSGEARRVVGESAMLPDVLAYLRPVSSVVDGLVNIGTNSTGVASAAHC